MKNSKLIFYIAIIYIFVAADVPILFINAHEDDAFYSKSDVKQHCNFDISKTEFTIDTLNSGVLTLRYKNSDIRVESKNN